MQDQARSAGVRFPVLRLLVRATMAPTCRLSPCPTDPACRCGTAPLPDSVAVFRAEYGRVAYERLGMHPPAASATSLCKPLQEDQAVIVGFKHHISAIARGHFMRHRFRILESQWTCHASFSTIPTIVSNHFFHYTQTLVTSDLLSDVLVASLDSLEDFSK